MNLFKVIGSGLGWILCLVSSSIYAAPTSTTQSHYFHPHRFYFDLGVGKSYDYAGSNSFLSSFSFLGGNFLKSSSSYSTPFFFAGLGYRWAQDYPWLPSINVGLQHRYTSPVNVFGQVTGFPDTYNYRMQQESWLIMAKADIFQWKKIMPYITVGMGASFNRISQFFGNTLIFEDQVGGSTTVTGDFSYSIGAGIDYAVKDDLWLSLGYSYDDFGKNKVDTLFRADMVPFASLKNATLHANSFFLSARYLFA